MALEHPAPDAQQKEIKIPEWENAAVDSKGEVAANVAGRATTPRRKRRLGDRMFLLSMIIVLVVLLALIIGLAVGLTERHKRNENLPLPSNARTFTGQLTYYGTGLGACGETSGDHDDIVSISHIVFDAAGSSSSNGGNSNQNPLCNKMLRASRYDEEAHAQRSVDLKVVDRCTGCKVEDLDTSTGAFEKLAPIASGRVDVTWAWLQPVQTAS